MFNLKKLTNPYFLTVFVTLVVLVAWVFIQKDSNTLSFGSKRLEIETAYTQAEHQKGLGGRSSLAVTQGMLFVFGQSDKYCFWMKDINFPIDILWLDEDKKVVDIEPNILPGTYPENFCPKTPAKFVLEVNAGLSQQSNVVIGTQL